MINWPLWIIVGLMVGTITLALGLYIRSMVTRVKSFDAKYHEELKSFEAKRQKELWMHDHFSGKKKEGEEESDDDDA